MILTVLDTTGIQDYVFSTNKLKQIVGASHLVNCASRNWVKDALIEAGIPHNILDLDGETPSEVFSVDRIEDGKIGAEVIYAGGGNTLILFQDEAKAPFQFTTLLTRKLLLDAPGLRLVVIHQDFDWDNAALGGKGGILDKAFEKLSQKKAESMPVTSEPGLGVTAECSFTALPAVSESYGRPISAEVQAKLDAEKEGNDRLTNLVSFQRFLDPPSELDELGQTKGEKSLLAVVHTDGNSMGDRMSKIREPFIAPKDNRSCVDAQRAFSLSIQHAAIKSLQATIDTLIANVVEDKIGGQVEIVDEKLPFRPVVVGGDDLTFICDGRLGVSLAAVYLKHASNQLLKDGEPLYCRAGIAIVKVNYPIARAYALAEDLCRSAKGLINSVESDLRDTLRKGGTGKTIDKIRAIPLDWHFATTSLLDDLETIRAREYYADPGPLTMRPIMVSKEIALSDHEPSPALKDDWRTWDIFLETVNNFLHGEDWAGKHNKVKALRQALRGGKARVNQFCTNYSVKLPPIPGKSQDNGWVGEHCAYFDAIESMDVLVQLK